MQLQASSHREKRESGIALASYASFGAVPFISMHTPTVGQKSRKS
jgi:hypothetical protein